MTKSITTLLFLGLFKEKSSNRVEVNHYDRAFCRDYVKKSENLLLSVFYWFITTLALRVKKKLSKK